MRRFVLGLFICSPLFALTENFSTSEHFDSSLSTAVWNIETRQMEVPLVVDRTAIDGEAQEDEPVLIGTGGDGAFNAETMTQFDLLEGAVINQVTLSGDRVYEFTSFRLPSGTTLRCSGSSALRIRVQGEARIEGTIDLRGGAGSGGAGGTATCGGGAGGAGGVGGNGADGTSVSSTALGGGGGGTASSADGGGAGYAGAGNSGGGGGGGVAGAEYDDEFISLLLGGSGGGGGAANGGTNGGGGGGGGGMLRLSTGQDLRVTGTGQILARGGNGETSGSAGDGGGGAGGGLILFAGKKLIIAGTINFEEGQGGGTNGDGSPGRGRLTSREPLDVTGSSITPGPEIAGEDRILYSAAAAEGVTLPYDTEVRFPNFVSFDATDVLSSGTIAYAIAGSDDNFTNDDTGFVDTDELARIAGKRYVRFRARLQGVTEGETPSVSGFTLNLEEGFRPTFRYRAAACASTHSPQSLEQIWLHIFGWLYLAALPLASSAMRRRKKAKASAVH